MVNWFEVDKIVDSEDAGQARKEFANLEARVASKLAGGVQVDWWEQELFDHLMYLIEDWDEGEKLASWWHGDGKLGQ